MPNVKQTIIDRTTIYRALFLKENYTVSTIDSLIGKDGRPYGKMSGIAWDNARLEVRNKERLQTRIDKLKEMFPSISDKDIEKISITDEANNSDGIVLKIKEIKEI